MFDVFIFYIKRFFYQYINDFKKKFWGPSPMELRYYQSNKKKKNWRHKKWSQSRKLKENISNGKIITGQKIRALYIILI